MLEIREIDIRRRNLEDIDKLEELTKTVSKSSVCGLGQTASNPVISTLKYFKDEYIEHAVDKNAEQKNASISKNSDRPRKCKGCGLCQKECPVGAIEGEGPGTKRHIDEDKCIKCGTCIKTCPFKAIG